MTSYYIIASSEMGFFAADSNYKIIRESETNLSYSMLAIADNLLTLSYSQKNCHFWLT